MISSVKLHLVPAVAVVLVGLAGTLTALALLYDAAFKEEASRLQAIVQSQVGLIEAVARFDAVQSPDYQGAPRAATISQIVDAYETYKGFGETGSFVVAEKDDEAIAFLAVQGRDGFDVPSRAFWTSDLAQPMRRALRGESGAVIGLDYRGVQVLAAYEPIPFLSLGLVAKIDLAEVRAPFIRAGLIALGVTVLLIAAAIFAFRWATDPILADLVRSREEALAADKAKSLFIANMSHELRTPLNAIIGFTDLMRQRVFGPVQPDQYAAYINDINKSGKHLLGLIEDVLDMNKIGQGTRALAARKVGLKGVIEHIVTPLRLRALEKNVEVKLDVPDDLPPVKMDVAAAKQIFVNLLENAVKFTPADGAVAVRAVVGVGGVVVTVRDTGVGIAPEDLARATQPFTQIEREQNRQHEGLGLGLALAKALTELQGGAFAIASERGRGTTVTLVLPLA